MLSLVIPVFKNESCLPRLLAELEQLSSRVNGRLEVLFVVDGSPDRCLEILRKQLPDLRFPAQLLSLSRNFGSFSAIVAGLEHGRGDYFAVLAADLQEPPDLIIQFLDLLQQDEADIVFGHRSSRSDSWFTRFSSNAFWFIIRRFVIPEMPSGGVDVFACSRTVRDRLVQLHEVNTNLIALLFWMGFRRKFVAYDRAARLEGRSAWNLSKKIRYSLDTIFNFTDMPVRLLLYAGAFGMGTATVAGFVVLISKLVGNITVPGYAATVLTVLFFGGMTSLGLGVLGQYLWLSLQNARQRPNYIVASCEENSFEPVAPLDEAHKMHLR